MEYQTNAELLDEKTMDRVRQLALLMKEMGLTSLEVDYYTRIRMERAPENMVLNSSAKTTDFPNEKDSQA